MRFILPILISALCAFGCSQPEEPNTSIIETLEVNGSSSSSRTFQGQVKHLAEDETIEAYGFEWQSRYGNWKALKPGKIKKGKFILKDTTQLSKWTTYSVRAVLETNNGKRYGNEVKFATEDK